MPRFCPPRPWILGLHLLLLSFALAVASARAEAPVELKDQRVHPTRLLVRELSPDPSDPAAASVGGRTSGGASAAAASSTGDDSAALFADLGLVARRAGPSAPAGLLILDEAAPAKAAATAAERAGLLARRIERLRASGRFAYVEPDYLVAVSALPNDAALANGTLWGLVNSGQSGGTPGADIDAARAWDLSTGSSSVIVAVIDSGIRSTHRELASRMWVNPDEIAGNGVDDDHDGYIDNIHGIDALNNDGDPTDDNDHGTHVAGTIGAAANDGNPLVGVAWNVRLMACKFLGFDGYGYTSDAIECINFAVANGARILNNSWGGGGYSQALRNSIAAARDAGVLFVAAAGNETNNNDAYPSYPANYPVDNILSVAATDRSDRLATFSNYGATTVHLAAPGVAIYSCTSGSDTEYSTFSGTSMATPHVAGVAALLLARYPAMSLVELRQRILTTTVSVPALQGRCTTGGRVNAYRALVAAAGGALQLTLTSSRASPLLAGEQVSFELAVTDLSPVTNATVTATGTGVGSIVFNNSGVGADRIAGDGIYSASVTVPTSISDFTLSVLASAPGKTAATLGRTYAVAYPPANDSFAARAPLVGASPTATGDSFAASLETDEPIHAGAPGGRSVWWSWTAPANGSVVLHTQGSDFDTLLAVYIGSSLPALNHVASNDDASLDLSSRVTFNAIAGQTYQIAVDGHGGAAGNIALALTLGPAQPTPANDTFAGRITLSGTSPSASGTNNGASTELGEPAHAGLLGGRSVWWTWTAPSAGTVLLRTDGSSFDTVLAVYTGDTLAALEPVAADDNDGLGVASRVIFNAVAGRAYRIAVDGRYGDSGVIALSLAFYTTPPAPANDHFAARATLSGEIVATGGTTLFASREADEPNHADNSGGASVWWTWTAPASGTFTVHSAGSTFNTLLAVYTGTTLGGLAPVGANDQDPLGGDTSRVTFEAVAGTAYQIALDGWNDGFGAGMGDYLLALVPGDGSVPPNDNFANRIRLTGASVATLGSNVGASKEYGEPQHADEPGGASVWWTWTAPSSGYVSIDTVGSTFFPLLAIYTGSTISTLAEVASDWGFTAEDGTNRLVFRASQGFTYHIAVDGWSYEDFQSTGNIRLRIAPQLPPVNDNFATRTTLLGYAAEVDAANYAASRESGEPNHAGFSGGASVWWTWRAPATGKLTLHTEGSDFDTLLAVYTGNSVSALTLRQSDDDDGEGPTSFLEFDVARGTTYHIAVDGYSGATGRIHLSLSHSAGASAPANDNFANRATLTGASGTDTRSNLGATSEPGEPRHVAVVGGTSLWWTWTAPSAGTLLLDTAGSDFDTLLAAYAGESVNNLAQVAANDQSPLGGTTSRVSFDVYRGFTYQIAVDGRAYGTGTVVLSHAFTPIAPPADSFEAFRGRHFTTAQLADAAVSGPAAPPHCDGPPQRFEKAIASDPRAAPTRDPPGPALVGGHLTLTYTRRIDAPDLTYVPEVSGALDAWSSGPAAVEELSVEIEGELLERVTVRDLTPATAASRRFIRLRVER